MDGVTTELLNGRSEGVKVRKSQAGSGQIEKKDK